MLQEAKRYQVLKEVNDTMPTSEIARFREELALHSQAMRAVFHAPAIIASHEIITHKYNAMGHITTKLASLVGEEEPKKSG